MDVIYGLIPSMIIIGLVLVVILFWAIKSGQFDDLEGDAQRILMDEDLTPQKKTPESPGSEKQNSENQSSEEQDTLENSPQEGVKKSFSDKADKNKEKD